MAERITINDLLRYLPQRRRVLALRAGRRVALHVGGYQVIKKWLSYRERALLDGDLKPEEARYVTEMYAASPHSCSCSPSSMPTTSG